MKTLMLAVLAAGALRAVADTVIPIEPGEHWWGGAWDLGGDMPLDDTSDYVMDLREGCKFQALAVNAGKTGEPILRSLEYVFPHRGYFNVKDEFLMGDDMLVVPMVSPGTRREAVIPPGTWLADDGSTVKGPAKVTLDVPLARIPHFILQK